MDGPDSVEEEDAAGSSGPLPGLEAILGANLRGELHQLGPGMVIDGKWEVRRLLGEGTFGLVYEAWHIKLDQPVAIKVLGGEHGGAEAKQRFLEEAQLMAGMSSEHVVRASDYGELPDGSPYFVMDLVKGKSLRHGLAERLSVGRAVKIGAEILDGLVEVHKRGVVHGDIKPENIVVGEDDDKARLLDFGLAQTSAAEGENVGGTLHYMAPEMLFDGAPASVRTDVYAVGVVLYEMLTGRLPRGHLGMEGRAKLREAWAHKPKPNPVLMHCKEVPAEQQEALQALDKLVMEALAREATARPKSALPMLEELRRLRSRLSPEALAPTLTSQRMEARSSTETRTTKPLAIVAEPQPRVTPKRAAIVVTVVVVAVVLGWWAWPRGEEVPEPKEIAVARTTTPEVETTEIASREAEGGLEAEALRGARGGIFVAMPKAGEVATRRHEALCMALGGDRLAAEGTLAVSCRRVPAMDVEDLMVLAEAAQVRVVVWVESGERESIEVRSTSHHRGNPLLSRLDGLPLPEDPEATARVAPVLRAVVGANTASGATGAHGVALPVLDWEHSGIGARWGVLSEWLRMQQGAEEPEDVVRREQLARGLEGMLAEARERGEHEGVAYYRDLAMVLWASSDDCGRSEPTLLGLSEADHHEGIRVAALLERAACRLEGNDAGTRAVEATALITEVFALGESPCVRLAAIGTISRIDRWNGNDVLWEGSAARLPGPESCEPEMWSRVFGVRGDALVERERWCDAAQAYARAYTSLRTEAKPLLNWAEYEWSCEPSRKTSAGEGNARQRVLEELSAALGSKAFARAQSRVSIAYMRWWLTGELVDAQRVLEEYAAVGDGEVALSEGVASDLEGQICKGMRAEACSRSVLARPKRAGDTEALRRGLGLR